MQVKYINPFIKASMNLFKDFLGLEVTTGKPFVVDDPETLSEVSGLIGLAGETAGAVVLSFSRDTAIKLVSKMVGQEFDDFGTEVADGVGELINIIAGNAKKDLDQFRIEISLPGVIVGDEYQLHWPEGIPVVSIPFESDAGPFSVNVSLSDIAE
jgi:chemotaxis protein CheX